VSVTLDRPTGTGLTASMLRQLADALDHTDPARLHVYVGVTDMNHGAPRAERIATVDAVAAVLGLIAEATKSDGGLWYHQASLTGPGIHLHVRTDIDPPAGRCVCGATCTHKPTRTAGGRP
jgi:hypothetical protein